MHVIVWAILTIVLSSTPSTAQPVFLAGRYVLPITQHDLYVSAPGPLGTTVTVNFRFKPIGSCTDTLDSILEYQLPSGYNQTPIDEVRRLAIKRFCAAASNSSVLASIGHIQCHSNMCRRGRSRRVAGRSPERIGTFRHRLHLPAGRFYGERP
jgi:hypothetical protein